MGKFRIGPNVQLGEMLDSLSGIECPSSHHFMPQMLFKTSPVYIVGSFKDIGVGGRGKDLPLGGSYQILTIAETDQGVIQFVWFNKKITEVED